MYACRAAEGAWEAAVRRAGCTRAQIPSADSEYIAQYQPGITDVLSETWDAKKRELRGESLLVAGDPYELRILAPNEEIASVETGSDTVKTKHARNGSGVRVELLWEQTGPVSCTPRFVRK